MADKLLPMDEGEAAVLRSMESKPSSSTTQSGDNVSGSKPTIYDALQDPGREAAASRPKTKPKFARLVRKIMTEQQNLQSETPQSGHARTRSNVQVYNLLSEMKDQESGKSLDDVFQQGVFYPGNIEFTSKPHETQQGETGGGVVDELARSDDVEQPLDTTPLLHNDANAVRRLKELKQGKSVFDAASIKAFFWGLLSHCWLLVFSAVLAGLAIILYYRWSNPSLDALPGNATLAWWCNFFARQIVLFEMARVIKFVLLDCIILAGGISVKIIGPFVTLLALQAKDWPFILSVWGILDACLLHGDDIFQNHWLYFTGWRIYSMSASSGLYIISSEPYLRLLLCMILAGAATALKRTYLAISFGRRQYSIYKPKLEKLLLDVVLLNEVASLSAQAEAMHEEMSQASSQKNGKNGKRKETTKRKAVNDVSWSSVKMTQEDLKDQSEPDESDGQRPGYGRSSSSGAFMKQLLDRWEEPVSVDKSEATIDDVLRFRRALAFMDETYPFGEDFGLASNRDEAIMSAEDVYRKLCTLEVRSNRLPFDTLALIALQDDESYDDVKKRAIRRIFHPDKDGLLTKLAFVQSCDALYRRLRYFLATVNNSASLDKVLENVFNSIFYFILALLILSLMNYNAWSLLVSMTSLLVSFSFAFGNTVSKYVQGVILIAVTRPFDLGDRVFLTSAGEIEKGFENAQNGWFVEDITLSATKLRFARTGEIAYLANNLLADMRIYNANRSPNANVVLLQMFHISILEKDNLKKFEEALRKFVEDRPRMWVELTVMVVVKIDNDMEQVFVQFVLRHRDSWQNVGRIYVHKAEVLKFIQDTSKRQKIIFETPPPRRVLYYGGELDQGAVVGEEDHRKDLLRAQNVRSSSDRSRSTGSLPPPYGQMVASSS